MSSELLLLLRRKFYRLISKSNIDIAILQIYYKILCGHRHLCHNAPSKCIITEPQRYEARERKSFQKNSKKVNGHVVCFSYDIGRCINTICNCVLVSASQPTLCCTQCYKKKNEEERKIRRCVPFIITRRYTLFLKKETD